MSNFRLCLFHLVTVALFVAAEMPETYSQRTTSSRKSTQVAVQERNIRAEMGFLASDAMQGRGSGTNHERIAAEYIGSLFRQFGLVPLGNGTLDNERSFVQEATVSAGTTWNVVGVLRGSDHQTTNEAIMITAHLDHLGLGHPIDGDAIFNGADDDASGCVAVIELARALASGRSPRRTIYFVCFGSEERGGLGASYFAAHSPLPLEQIVAHINFEMIGRPDPKVGRSYLWFTGYDRSTLGAELARRGASLVADPYPEHNFFQRSDNYTFALRGVVAHTVSSFGLHTDYHRPSDEIGTIDFPFMTRSISSLIAPIRWLANSSFKPKWLPGRAPTRQN
jgi:Zn-dependent M28 family amino/carboxypeptidase